MYPIFGTEVSILDRL